jgi:TRAP-type C4-dicarboxylate transport system substrate-binding protein
MNLVHRTSALALLAATFAACGGKSGTPPGAAKAGGKAAAKPVVVTLANHENHARDLGEFGAAVKRLSHGTMRIDLRTAWRADEIDYDRGTLADVRAGKVDMAKIAVRSWDELGVTSLQPLVTPMLVDSLPLQERVLRDDVARQMLRGVDAAGVTGVGLLPGELRKPVALKGKLLGASDYRGRTIGIRPSHLSADALRALGASPKGYLPGGALPGLDGVELDLNTLASNGYDEAARSMTGNVNLWPRAYTLTLGPAAARRLTSAQRAILREAAAAAVPAAIRRLQEEAGDFMAGLCNRHFTIAHASPTDLAGLAAAFAPLSAKIARDGQARSSLARIKALKREVGAPADTPPACRHETISAAPGPKAIQGTWTTTLSRDEFVAARPKEPIEGNYGKYELSFKAGRFTLTLEDGSEATGVYSVHGDRITIAPGGDTASNMGNGEKWTYRWSVYRDRLSFRRIDGTAYNPTGLIVKPFTRG